MSEKNRKKQEKKKKIRQQESSRKQRENILEKQWEKNQEFVLEITDMGTQGEGIGKIDGYTIFVKDAMIGDVIRGKILKTKKHFAYGRMIEMITPSPERVSPKCPVARQCGGCQIQHCSYERQLKWKEEKVKNCLERIGKFSVVCNGEQKQEQEIQMEPILAMETPYHYRNKAQFPVGKDKEGKLVAGFYAGRSHTIIHNTDCAIQHPCNKPIVDTILSYMEDCGITAYEEEKHTGLVRHILTRVGVQTGQVMVCLVINGETLPYKEELVKRLCQETLLSLPGDKRLHIESICINENRDKTNVILGKKVSVLYGKAYIEDFIGDIKYQISPLSFYQVNPLQTKKLYETALEYADLQGGEVVWDLYCGIGTISLFLAQKAKKVCGVEIVPAAIEDARKNAALNGMANVEFFVGAAEEVVPQQYEKSDGKLQADVVSLDPPRKGCDEKLLETVIKMNPQKIVYVSCDPATLARDLRYLCDRGYELKKVRPCDMFGHSYHVETVVLLSRKAPDAEIK